MSQLGRLPLLSMSITLRRQYVNYEPDEYELLGWKQSSEVKLIFEQYPWEEQVKKHLELVESHAFPSLSLEQNNTSVQDEEVFKKVAQLKNTMTKFKEKTEKPELEALK